MTSKNQPPDTNDGDHYLDEEPRKQARFSIHLLECEIKALGILMMTVTPTWVLARLASQIRGNAQILEGVMCEARDQRGPIGPIGPVTIHDADKIGKPSEVPAESRVGEDPK